MFTYKLYEFCSGTGLGLVDTSSLVVVCNAFSSSQGLIMMILSRTWLHNLADTTKNVNFVILVVINRSVVCLLRIFR